MACNCNDNKTNCYNISMGCVVPALANPNAYYTKSEVDEKLEDIVSSGCCITPEEVDEKIESAITDIDLSEYAKKSEIPTVPTNVSAFVNDVPYLTEHQQLKTINNESLIGEGNITISSETVDLSNYYNKQDIDAMLDDKATQTWVLNQHYVTNSELIQYITNLQIQINSLQESISGCCGGGGSGETIYRWITMTSENDYECSGTTKYTKEKKQQSTDNGVTWEDVSPAETRIGNTIIEENSVDCGYVPTNLKFSGVLRNGNTVEVPCNSSTTLSSGETYTTIGYTSVEIGDCVTTIGEKAFLNEIHVTNLTVPSGVTTIERMAFDKIGSSQQITNFTLTLNEGLVTIGEFGFAALKNLKSVTIPNTVQTISNGAFESCTSLSSITIGSGVTSIGNGAFSKSSGNTQYETITILATTPPTLGAMTVFYDGGNCPIYVPAASVNAYKSAWRGYADRIFPIQ